MMAQYVIRYFVDIGDPDLLDKREKSVIAESFSEAITNWRLLVPEGELDEMEFLGWVGEDRHRLEAAEKMREYGLP